MTTSSEATTAAPAVAVLGSANADLVVEVDRRPAGGETIIGSDLQQFAGGKGANQSAACAKAGSSTLFVGCVGEDSNGEFLVRSLEQAGVDVSSVNRIAKPSGTAIIFLTPDGENSIVVSPGANAAFDVEIAKATQPVWSRADAVVMNFELPMATVNYVAAAAATHNQRVILNAAPAFSVDEATLRVCDPLVVNEHEAEVVLGEKLDNYERVAQALRGKGAR
ncbi:MAG: ribokinase, partial [Aurantimicrobium sp.]